MQGQLLTWWEFNIRTNSGAWFEVIHIYLVWNECFKISTNKKLDSQWGEIESFFLLH